jgi:uroporphyrin-III C-methyltransferase
MKPVGRVSLVGAGPGDPELLTLKALRAIGSASLLLVDDLVSDEVLAYRAPTARVVFVGKRGGCKSTPQAFILRLMVQSARQGHQVVRLKGGDPFIFGRGGEELEHLRQAGIETVVVNGVTAGLAAANALGVALTHREQAHGVLFITGHAKPGAPGPNWRSIGATARDEKLTLVIYMGVSGAANMQSELLGALSADTPVAIVQNASLPEQRQGVCTLGDLVGTITREGLASPSVIVVGDVLGGLAAASGKQVLAA